VLYTVGVTCMLDDCRRCFFLVKKIVENNYKGVAGYPTEDIYIYTYWLHHRPISIISNKYWLMMQPISIRQLNTRLVLL